VPAKVVLKAVITRVFGGAAATSSAEDEPDAVAGEECDMSIELAMSTTIRSPSPPPISRARSTLPR
jgi:hypothetical protein